MKRLLLFGGIAFAALQIVDLGRLAQAGSKLGFALKSVKPKISKGNIILTINSLFTNPTSKEILLDYIFLDLKFNGKHLGSIREEISSKLNFLSEADENQLRARYTIKGESVSTLPIVVTIGPLEALTVLGKQILEALLTGKIPKGLKMEVTGNIKANGLSIPYNQIIPLTE